MSKCKEVFHQEAGLVCDKTIRIAKLEQENKLLKDAIKREIKRCGGCVPILREVLKDVTSK